VTQKNDIVTSFPRSCVGMHTQSHKWHTVLAASALVCIPTEDGGNEPTRLSVVMWIKQNIGAIRVLEIIWVKRGCWRFVANGKAGMHSHTGAWE